MAHDLHFNSTKNQYSFFSVKEKAWHGLGKIVEDYPTSKEAMQFAGLDFTVEKRPLYTHDTESMRNGEGAPSVKIPDFFSTIRTDNDTPLGIVGKDYEIVQNIDAFAFFDEIVGGGEGIMYETAGALGRGERIFITAKLPSYIKVGNGDNDLIEKYLFLSTGHDGKSGVTVAFTPIRIVCNNTLQFALSTCKHKISIPHTKDANQKLKLAHQVMGITNTLSQQLEDIFNVFAKKRISTTDANDIIMKAIAPEKYIADSEEEKEELSAYFKNTLSEIKLYSEYSPTQSLETTKGTVYGTYNAITGYFQNVKKYRSEEVKFKSQMFGGRAEFASKKAFTMCMNYCDLS